MTNNKPGLVKVVLGPNRSAQSEAVSHLATGNYL